MTNITIPIQEEYLETIDSLIKSGDFDNRSQFIRTAIKKMLEDKEIEEILEASKMVKLGEVFSGDLDELVAKHA
jgi:Arc/MetJ-type ribon-helix-helix transcriptional regulator